MTQQTEAQRLAERVQDLSSMFKTPSRERGICNQSVELLRRQDELLGQALEVLEWYGINYWAPATAKETIAAIRAHREAK